MRAQALLSLARRRATLSGLAGQAGVGIVELMVTLLLGALLTAGIIALFNANRQSFRLQDNLAVAQEAGSFSIEFLSNDLRIAGYPGDINNSVGVIDTGNSGNDVTQAGSRPVNGVATAVNFVDDRLATIFVADPLSSMRSCNGEDFVQGNFVGNVYWVRDTADGLDRELVCQGVGYTLAGSTITNRALLGQPAALMSGVDSFQVLYGVDATHKRNLSITGGGCPAASSPDLPNVYVPASLLAAAASLARPAPADCYLIMSQMSALRAVRIGILVRTGADVDALNIAAPSFTVLDRTLTTANFPLLNDGRIRRVFTTTVALRNTEMVLQ